MDEPTPQLLKADTLGRVRTPRQRREALLDEFERSGASASRFAKLSGVKYQTFAGWVQRRRRQRGAAGVQTVDRPRQRDNGQTDYSNPGRRSEARTMVRQRLWLAGVIKTESNGQPS